MTRGGIVVVVCLLLMAAAQSWVPLPYRWADVDIPVEMVLDVGDPWDAAAGEALNVWNGAGARFEFTSLRSSGGEEPSCAAVDADDRHVVVWDDSICGDAWGEETLAVTRAWWRESTGEAVDADVIFNGTLDWEIYGGPLRAGARDFRRTAIHEFGHVLGLDHANDPQVAIMYHRATDVDTIRGDDVDGITGIYGPAIMDARRSGR